MKKQKNVVKMILFIMLLTMCMCVPVNAAKLKSGAYVYTTKTTGSFGKEKTTIYKQRSGSKKKKLITVSGRVDKLHYVYSNKLYYTRSYGTSAPSPFKVEVLNLKNNRRSVLTEKLEIVGHRGRYALVTPCNDAWIQPLYIIDMKTKKTKWIANNVLYGASNIMKNGKIYYLKCNEYNYKTGKLKYAMYSCKKDGSGKKCLKTFSSNATNSIKITDKYIVLGGYGMKNKTYRY